MALRVTPASLGAINNYRLQSLAQTNAGWKRLTVDEKARLDLFRLLDDMKAKDVLILKNSSLTFLTKVTTLSFDVELFWHQVDTVAGRWIIVGPREDLVQSKTQEVREFQNYREQVEAAEATQLREHGRAALRAEAREADQLEVAGHWMVSMGGRGDDFYELTLHELQFDCYVRPGTKRYRDDYTYELWGKFHFEDVEGYMRFVRKDSVGRDGSELDQYVMVEQHMPHSNDRKFHYRWRGRGTDIGRIEEDKCYDMSSQYLKFSKNGLDFTGEYDSPQFGRCTLIGKKVSELTAKDVREQKTLERKWEATQERD